jgi:hypothetical protein
MRAGLTGLICGGLCQFNYATQCLIFRLEFEAIWCGKGGVYFSRVMTSYYAPSAHVIVVWKLSQDISGHNLA